MREEVLLGKVDPQSGTKFQAPSRSHQKLSGGVKEARKQKQQHWDINSPLTLQSSASFRNSRRRLLTKLRRERRQFGAHPVCLFLFVLLSGWAFRATTQSRFSFSSWRFCYPCRLLWLSIKSASVQACVYSVRHCCFSQVFISSRCETLCLLIKHVTSTFSSRASWQAFFISFGYDGGELNNKACC